MTAPEARDERFDGWIVVTAVLRKNRRADEEERQNQPDQGRPCEKIFHDQTSPSFVPRNPSARRIPQLFPLIESPRRANRRVRRAIEIAASYLTGWNILNKTG